MGRRKGALGYYKPVHNDLVYQGFILRTNEVRIERSIEEARRRVKVTQERGERLVRLVETFTKIFDVEFPFVSMQVKATIFPEWEKYAFNKELVQADIQISGLLTRLGETEAFERWKEVYATFRKQEGM